MKKFLILWMFLIAHSGGFAHADNRCGVSQVRACNNFLSRFDAFKKIQENENDYQQAVDNLALVENIQKQARLNREYAVDNFIFIQHALGGADATLVARESFQQIANYISANNPLHRLANVFSESVQIENDMSQARQNFDLIMTGVRGGLSLEASADLFKSILHLQGGADSTILARESYNMLLVEKNKYSPRTLFDSWSEVFRTENDAKQAMQSFRLVLLGAQKRGSLPIATRDFLSVLQQVGGANFTDKAQDLYKKLYGI